MRAIALAFVAALAAVVPVAADQPLLVDDFARRPPGLITNQYAYEHPSDPAARKDAIWVVTSGSFFADRGSGFSGVPDHVPPNALSTNGNNSATFRAQTQRADFAGAAVSFDLQTVGFFHETLVPPRAPDGVRVWLRDSAGEAFLITVSARDNVAMIEKKMPGGSGGKYFELASAPFAVRLNAVVHVQASAQTQRDGSVIVILTMEGTRILRARDDGRVGGPPIHAAGRIGISADNTEFYIRRFEVTALPAP